MDFCTFCGVYEGWAKAIIFVSKFLPISYKMTVSTYLLKFHEYVDFFLLPTRKCVKLYNIKIEHCKNLISANILIPFCNKKTDKIMELIHGKSRIIIMWLVICF